MTAVIIFAVACAGMVLSALYKPDIIIFKRKITTFWIAPFLGAILLLLLQIIDFDSIYAAVTELDTNPIEILVLFLCMSILSIFLDETGFFRYLAISVLKRAKHGQKTLFFSLYALVSVLTVFTSNDIIILTFTPFICYFAKNSDIDPVPFLIAEFVAANTWSMTLVIGNPTNIYLFSSMGISFWQYCATMILPTLFAGVVSLGLLYAIFYKKLNKPVSECLLSARIENKFLFIVGISHLTACILLLTVSEYIGIEMWLVSLLSCLSLFAWCLGYRLVTKKYSGLVKALKSAPWEVVPFILSMFVFVLALSKCGVTEKIAEILGDNIWSYGYASFFASNLINNIPMSVLFSDIIANAPLTISKGVSFAAVIGSNIGAFLTPLGALAGIMWLSLLKKHNVKFSFIKFLGFGAAIALPTMTAALFGLYLVI
ncbi:MAG TPA: ArsB/NhaD family transporter [Eubacteriales bacterium]|nr:ArsB/NhaD family transporter [Eubacteriales bacterium]